MSAIFVRDDEQRRLAERSARDVGAEHGRALTTQILPFTGFTLAEDYHQKYRLRRLKGVVRELEAIYPQLEDFVRSTVTTRLNAWIGRDDGLAQFEAQREELGLSEQALQEVRAALR